ncbi:putative oxidoreductase YciK [Candidatus Phycosocius bacilliformis]|uniref:Putative oxidoreductase YciK n=1 Tax=Candidatus Phycosocius bacilliformis TaxID=1445552 RepID=A0A2P2E8H4_9PROT|nr:SDR family NAD(P)-dependent oxidoreductase [Candidatus Phycosocius bacilliformis]GBF57334.1 putative oxidoreductase YciK [Candidatus Phycosocius bacilliformis]
MSESKIVLVTGASRGIGRAAALACARAGMQVIATGRAQKALEDLDDDIRKAGGLPATLVPMDLTDFDAIDRLGGALYQRYGRLDGLIHAAAHLGDLTPVAHVTPRVGEQLIQTNLTASWRLMRSMEPLLIQSPAGRAIFFTSGVVANPRANWGLYAATKAGVEALAKCWADEIEFKKVVVTILNPGPVATAMRKNAFPGEDPATLPQPEHLSSLILDLMGDGPHQTGQTIHFRQTEHFKAWQAAHGPEASA